MSNIFKSIKVREIFSNMLYIYFLVSYHIVKNKMAATGVNKMAAMDFFSTLSKGLITQKVLQLQFFHEICCSATLSLAIRWYIVWGSIACHK